MSPSQASADARSRSLVETGFQSEVLAVALPYRQEEYPDQLPEPFVRRMVPAQLMGVRWNDAFPLDIQTMGLLHFRQIWKHLVSELPRILAAGDAFRARTREEASALNRLVRAGSRINGMLESEGLIGPLDKVLDALERTVQSAPPACRRPARALAGFLMMLPISQDSGELLRFIFRFPPWLDRSEDGALMGSALHAGEAIRRRGDDFIKDVVQQGEGLRHLSIVRKLRGEWAELGMSPWYHVRHAQADGNEMGGSDIILCNDLCIPNLEKPDKGATVRFAEYAVAVDRLPSPEEEIALAEACPSTSQQGNDDGKGCPSTPQTAPCSQPGTTAIGKSININTASAHIDPTFSSGWRAALPSETPRALTSSGEQTAAQLPQGDGSETLRDEQAAARPQGTEALPPPSNAGKAALSDEAASMLEQVAARLLADRAIRFGPDYSSCRWGTESFTFTPTQAACVRHLDEARQNGTPEVNQACILSLAESDHNQLRRVFKNGRRTHPAWGTLIVKGKNRGTYRLENPPVP